MDDALEKIDNKFDIFNKLEKIDNMLDKIFSND